MSIVYSWRIVFSVVAITDRPLKLITCSVVWTWIENVRTQWHEYVWNVVCKSKLGDGIEYEAMSMLRHTVYDCSGSVCQAKWWWNDNGSV